MKFNSLIISALAFAVTFSSCTKEPENETVFKGSITGKVRLVDEFGVIATDHQGVILTTTGNITGNTNEGGSYLIYGLGDGLHDIEFKKYGYGTFKKFAIPVTNFANTELTGIDTLGQLSTTLVTALTASINPVDSSCVFNCTVAPTPDATNKRGIRLFFSRNSGVSHTNYEYTPSYKWLATQSSGNLNGFSAAELYANGFSRGDTLYVVAYGEGIYANSYIDPATFKKVYPNVNSAHPSNVVQLILQ
jgi:hypothetical protein